MPVPVESVPEFDADAKKKKRSRDPVFARPVFANELLDEAGKKRFNELPSWQRHLIKRIVDHGDLPRAAREAGVSTYVKKHVDHRAAQEKSVADALNNGGLATDDLVSHLKECLEAQVTARDKHGNFVNFQDLNLKLKTLEVIFRLRGDFVRQAPEHDPKKGVLELFEETKLDTDKA